MAWATPFFQQCIWRFVHVKQRTLNFSWQHPVFTLDFWRMFLHYSLLRQQRQSSVRHEFPFSSWII
jgi:hypothetical protein